MFIRQLHGIHDFQRIGHERNNDGITRDFSVRYIVGRNGEAVSTLEEFDPKTGHITNVFWQIDYDPSERQKLIYG